MNHITTTVRALFEGFEENVAKLMKAGMTRQTAIKINGEIGGRKDWTIPNALTTKKKFRITDTELLKWIRLGQQKDVAFALKSKIPLRMFSRYVKLTDTVASLPQVDMSNSFWKAMVQNKILPKTIKKWGKFDKLSKNIYGASKVMDMLTHQELKDVVGFMKADKSAKEFHAVKTAKSVATKKGFVKEKKIKQKFKTFKPEIVSIKKDQEDFREITFKLNNYFIPNTKIYWYQDSTGKKIGRINIKGSETKHGSLEEVIEELHKNEVQIRTALKKSKMNSNTAEALEIAHYILNDLEYGESEEYAFMISNKFDINEQEVEAFLGELNKLKMKAFGKQLKGW